MVVIRYFLVGSWLLVALHVVCAVCILAFGYYAGLRLCAHSRKNCMHSRGCKQEINLRSFRSTVSTNWQRHSRGVGIEPAVGDHTRFVPTAPDGNQSELTKIVFAYTLTLRRLTLTPTLTLTQTQPEATSVSMNKF